MCLSPRSGRDPRLSRSNSLRYDLPRPATPLEQYDAPRPLKGPPAPPQQEYDVPRPSAAPGDRSSGASLMSCDSTSSSASSQAPSESLSLSSAGAASSGSSLEAYDVPPEPRRLAHPQPPVYDVPPQVSRDRRASSGSDSSSGLEGAPRRPLLQQRPLPEPPGALLRDYDYVDLDSKGEEDLLTKALTAEDLLKKALTEEDLLKKALTAEDLPTKALTEDNLLTKARTEGDKAAPQDPNDRQVLSFYAAQAALRLRTLHAAIDAFLLTVEANQPPKVFLAHSKGVVLAAHKLVHIGDTVHRNVSSSEVRTRVLNCTNALCDALRSAVDAAKGAALRFPSVAAVQAMVDAFVALSHLAANLRKAFGRD